MCADVSLCGFCVQDRRVQDKSIRVSFISAPSLQSGNIRDPGLRPAESCTRLITSSWWAMKRVTLCGCVCVRPSALPMTCVQMSTSRVIIFVQVQLLEPSSSCHHHLHHHNSASRKGRGLPVYLLSVRCVYTSAASRRPVLKPASYNYAHADTVWKIFFLRTIVCEIESFFYWFFSQFCRCGSTACGAGKIYT